MAELDIYSRCNLLVVETLPGKAHVSELLGGQLR